MTTGTVGLEAIAPVEITISGVLPMTTGTVGLTAAISGIAYADKMLWIEGDTGLTDQGQYAYAVTASNAIGSGATYNGHASLSGNGTSSYAKWDSKTELNAAINSGAFAMVLVAKSTSNDSGFAVAWNNSGDNSNYRTIQPDAGSNSNKPRAYFTTNGGSVSSIEHTHASTTGTLHVYSVRVTGGTAYMSVDGETEQTTSLTAASDTDRVSIFSLLRPANPSGVQFDEGDICAFIVSDNPTDTTGISAEVTALKTKYGIA
jgi:hypothetical protein